MTTPTDNPSNNAKTNLLSTLPIEQLRQQLLSHCPDLDPTQWWLLGTSGCHLCDVAESILQQLQRVTPIQYQLLDIITLEDAMMSEFATLIPVIITPSARINYPFSILDLQQLT